MQAFTSLSGVETRIRYGTAFVGAALSLTFQNLTNAAAALISDHWRLARGGFESFVLPSEVSAGGWSIEPGQQWRYATAPSFEWTANGVVTVTVSLVQVA